MACVENPTQLQNDNGMHQNQENYACGGPPPLNVTVWLLVWPFIPPKEKGILRLLSTAFKNMVDIFLGVDVTLDNASFESEQRAEIPTASHLILNDLVYPVSMDFIKKPDMIKTIIMDGAISSATWTELLLHCQNVEIINISPGFATETIALHEGQSPTALPSLKQLLFPNLFRKNRYQQNISWKIIENFLVCYQMPKLEKLTVRLFFKCQTDFASSFEVIEKFLRGHSKSLQHLELILRKSSACCHPHELEFPEVLKLPHSEAKKGDFEILKLKTFVANCDSPSHEVLDNILQDQTILESIEYDRVWTNWNFYMPLMKRNETTLRTAKIRYAIPIIDLAAFADCINLQELKMGTDHQMQKDEINMINFSSLPTSLNSLQIEKYTVESADLASISNLVNLRSLELEFLSNTECENTGITAEVVKNILSLPKLKVIYLEEFEKPHTSLISIDNDIRAVNMIKGEYVTQKLGCLRYGVAVAPPEIFEKWDSRIKKYHGSHRIALC